MRYVILVLLNLPIILLALVNIITQYKMKKVSSRRFKHQVTMWLLLLIVLICSFPLYNSLNNKSFFDADQLSAFDIVQSTAIIYMVYTLNNHRRKLENNEHLIRDLHQELSIKLSKKESS